MTDQQPTAGSFGAVQYHGKKFLVDAVRANPSRYAVVVAVLTFLVLILIITTWVYYRKWKDLEKPEGMIGILPNNNLRTGSNNTLWQHGSLTDQPGLRNIGHEMKPHMYAVYSPAHRGYTARRSGAGRRGSGSREHYLPAGAARGLGEDDGTYTPVDPSTHASGLVDPTITCPNGTKVKQSFYEHYGPDVACSVSGGAEGCGKSWDPSATAEAQALSTVGSYQHDPYGEKALQNAVNLDNQTTLTDDQLMTMMAQTSSGVM